MKTKVKKSTLLRSDTRWGYIMVAPQMFGLIAFMVVPIIFSLIMCFMKWDYIRPPQFVGVSNFIRIFSDGMFYVALKNTLLFTLMAIPFTVILSFILALALTNKIRGATLYRSFFFMPNVTSTVAVSLVFLWVYNPEQGLINLVLHAIGIKGPLWLASTTWALPSITILAVWRWIGSNMILFMAGMSGIPGELYEAAVVDGANARQRLFKITLPLLTPTIFFVMVMIMIGSFQVFDEVRILTRGGPGMSTYTLVYYVYNVGFEYLRIGESSVISWVLFIMLFIVTFIQFKLSDRWVNYDV